MSQVAADKLKCWVQIKCVSVYHVLEIVKIKKLLFYSQNDRILHKCYVSTCKSKIYGFLTLPFYCFLPY